jgi:phosphohistidine phosphatase
MMLYILRHAEAEPAGQRGGDAARKLTPRGRARMRAASAGLVALGLKFDAILTSPLVRAKETAEIVAEAYPDGAKPQELQALVGSVPADKAVAALAPFARNENVLAVGHEPQLSALVALLLTGTREGLQMSLKKGACVALELTRRFETGTARLSWMLTQRQLRRIGKRSSRVRDR